MRNFDIGKSIELFHRYSNLLTQAQRQAVELYLIKKVPIADIAKIMASTRQAAHDSVRKGLKKLNEIHEKLS